MPKIEGSVSDTAIVNFLKSAPPSAPLELRDFDRDPRFAGKYPSAYELWHEQREIDAFIDADAFPDK